MKTLYLKYFAADKNAGDLASPYLFAKISGQNVTPIPLRELSEDEHYMGVGSTLAHSEGNTIVWGTGIMKPTLAPRATPKHIIGVRGHLTQARLREIGLGDVPVTGDAGLIMADFFRPDVAVKYDFGLIPHYVDEQDPFCDLVRDKGGLVISAQQDLEPYLRQLLQCRLIVSSSLHGLIFAHSYGLPAIWVTLSDKVVGEGHKFRDYYSFLNRPPEQIPRWSQDADFAANLSKADCPPRPAQALPAAELLFEDLKRRGYA